MKGRGASHAKSHAPRKTPRRRTRELVLFVPDLRDAARNRLLDDLLHETLQSTLRLMEG
jgi:hypothetical protein